MRDMRTRQVEAVLVDIVEALVDVHARLRFASDHFERFERRPRQGPNCDGRFLPVASAVTPSARPSEMCAAAAT
jgi:hypothetical protein